MPYIELELRDPIYSGEIAATRAGDLTYLLYQHCVEFLGASPRYEDFARVLGALEATKLELYRRRVAPYEDQKILQNGDVQ